MPILTKISINVINGSEDGLAKKNVYKYEGCTSNIHYLIKRSGMVIHAPSGEKRLEAHWRSLTASLWAGSVTELTIGE